MKIGEFTRQLSRSPDASGVLVTRLNDRRPAPRLPRIERPAPLPDPRVARGIPELYLG
ncbi:MAG TPA: hypothetical protein VGH99_07475 [Pseudonocardia sp.]